ncbi:MAG TPA: protealysin inhibitor emfourin, partial [Burkholderiaceae bacterium]
DFLQPEEQAVFDKLVAGATGWKSSAPTRGHADGFSYTLTLWMADGSSRTVTFGDDDGHPAAIDALLNWLRARGT